MRMVSSRQAVLNVVEDIGKDDMRQMLVYRRWASEAEKQIGGKYAFKREMLVLPIDNGKTVKLPCHVRKVLALTMGEYDDDCEAIFNRYCNGVYTTDYTSLDTGIGIVVIQPPNHEARTEVMYDIIAGNGAPMVQFNCKVTESYVTVLVLSYQIDDEGYILVHEDHLDAIGAYIKHRIAERSLFSPQRMTMAQIGYFKNEWLNKKPVARAASSQMSPQDIAELSNIINNPLSGSTVRWFVNSREYA